jgi:hypothetical protein
MSASMVARKRAGLALLLCLLFCLPVGASIAFLSALERVVGRAVPYPDAEDIFRLRQAHPEIPGGSGDFSGAQVELLRNALGSPEAVAGYRVVTASFRSEGLAESIRLAIASPGYLTLVAGDRPPDPALRARGAYFSRRFWHRRFGKAGPGAAPAFFVDDRPYAVLGLLPAVPLYPMDADLLVFDDAFPADKYDASSFSVVALLKRDPARREGWRAKLAGHTAELAALAGITGSRLGGYTISARPLQEDLAGKAFGLLAPLQLCALGLLVLGAFNSWSVWSWHLARERADLVTRMALGAEPAMLLRRHLALAAATAARRPGAADRPPCRGRVERAGDRRGGRIGAGAGSLDRGVRLGGGQDLARPGSGRRQGENGEPLPRLAASRPRRPGDPLLRPDPGRCRGLEPVAGATGARPRVRARRGGDRRRLPS